MGWDGPILTDSGGFQVFSLRDTIAAVDDDGVTFRSVYDGDGGPLHAGARRRDPGAARLRHRDVPRRLPAGRRPAAELERAVRLTTRWASRQREAPRAPGQLLFGIAQGGSDRELRARSIEEIVELGFDGYALGGLSVGEPRPRDARRGRLGGAAAAGRAAALLHGDRRSRGHPRGDRARDRHVRLRAADADRADRHGADLGRPPQPPERAASRATRGRSTSAAAARPARASRAPTSATSSTSRSCSGCGCSACTTCASCST